MSTSNPHPAREFKAACKLLLKRIPKPMTDQVRTKFAIPEFEPTIGIKAQLEELESKLEAFLSSRKEFLLGATNNRTEMLKAIISQWYRSSYPFLTTILSATKEASSVLSPRYSH
jgi:hypothetical protein